MRARTSTIAALGALTLTGCGTASEATSTAVTTVQATPSSAACVRTAKAELVSVAQRVYDQAQHGRNAAAAVRRLRRSARLARAVAVGDRAAAAAALQPLLKHQITRIEITGASGRVLARHGSTPAYGPVRGTFTLGGRVVGHYVLAVTRQADLVGLVRELTTATATFGHTARVADARLPARLFPADRAVIALRIPRLPSTLCRAAAADTRAATIGFVAQNLLSAEVRGGGAHRAMRHAEKDPAFRAAVIAGDPAAVRAAIVGFFRDKHFHIVRARAWSGTRLIDDVGGPHVLSPVLGAIRRPGGAVAGRFLISIQDDTGYIKLLHRFTGADVTLSTPAGVVPGSNVVPGPAFAPGLGHVAYHGRRWRTFGLTGTAFPSGPLDVALLLR